MDIKILVITTALLLGSAGLTEAASYTVKCSGMNVETFGFVSGQCTDGDFQGTDSNTGSPLTGSCELNGAVDAIDRTTGEHISGDCIENSLPQNS